MKPARTLLPVLMWASRVALHADEPDRARVAQGPRPFLRPVADFQNSADHTPLTSFNTGPLRFTFTGRTGDPQGLKRDDRGRWSV